MNREPEKRTSETEKFAESFRTMLGVSEKRLPKSPDAWDIYKAAPVGSNLSKEQVLGLCSCVREMQRQRETRPWWYIFRHPIASYREWNAIRTAKEVLTDKFEARPEDFMTEETPEEIIPDEEVGVRENVEVKEAEEKNELSEEAPEKAGTVEPEKTKDVKA